MRNTLLLGVAAAALVAPVAAMAQETTSSIRGTVTTGGQPVAGASVVATDVQSGTKSQTTTGADGSFNLPGLRVGGPYTVDVTSAAGNKSVTDIYTVVQQAYTLPVELAATAEGAEATTADIVVTASSIKGAGVTSAGPQTVLTQADISKVASVNRDIRDIERRDPFATLDYSNSGDRGGAVSFAGVNPRYNRFTINGVTVGDTFGLGQDASPNIRGPVPFDALAQVSTSVAPYDFRQSGFQGGAIDTVLLSGTNEFHGTGFYSQNTDGLSGSRIKSRTFAQPDFKSETYGATLDGPLIKDKLFFMVSAERNTDPRPYSTQVGSYANPGLITSAIGNVTGIATGKGLQPGSILTINDRKDEKIAGRIDWNIATGQRLSLSYINSYDVQASQNNTTTSNSSSNFGYGLSSNAYALSELLRAGIAQLNSDWTDNFSTEARVLYRWTRRGQEPLGGRPYGQFQVCNDATSVGSQTGCSSGSPKITFGPDNFRQTNTLFFDTWEGSLLTRYRTGGHEVKALVDITKNRTFNNFVPNSLGSWYFDSLADFRAGNANQLQYAAVIGGDPLGAAADFNYTQYTFGAQDDWQVTDSLLLTYGARYSMYGMRDYPVYNPYFNARYGFSNLKTYKGLDQFEPRVSFKYTPVGSRLQVRGGAGIFGGGSPDIYLSNSFSNTITTSSVTINRADCGTKVPTNVCNAALNNVTGQVPDVVTQYVAGQTGNLASTNTGAISPNFHLPRSLKATLSADYTLFGFDVGADYYYSKTIDGIIFTDARSVVVGTLPDGRPRYSGVIAPNDSNYDIIVGNSHQGRSHIGVIRIDKTFDWGLSAGGSYTLQDVRDVGNATSSTINSNYRYQLFANPNFPQLGTSSDQITWSFKYHLGFDHAFFGDYKTRIQLFGETRAGRPYSFTMKDNVSNSRTDVFGTVLTGSNDTNLLYVPTGLNDPLVQYDSTATAQALDTFINATKLKDYRGKIAGKNIARNPAFTQIDIHLEQEIPTFIGGSRISVFADINNLPNLINKNWGGLRQLGFPYTAPLVSVNCVTAAGAVIPTGTPVGAAGNPAGACVKYQYSSFTTPNDNAINFNGSLYAIRLGVRFTF